MCGGVRDGNSRTLRDTEYGKPFGAHSIDHRLEITHKTIKTDFCGVGVRQTGATRIISDKSVLLRKAL